MAKEKNSFLLYCDIIHTVEKLDDVQAGKLFKHLLKYVNDQDPTPENALVEIAFEPIKQSLKRDLIKYESIRERNSENAKKRWNATASDRIPKVPNNTKNADSDSVSDSDINNIDYQALLDSSLLLNSLSCVIRVPSGIRISSRAVFLNVTRTTPCPLSSTYTVVFFRPSLIDFKASAISSYSLLAM